MMDTNQLKIFLYTFKNFLCTNLIHDTLKIQVIAEELRKERARVRSEKMLANSVLPFSIRNRASARKHVYRNNQENLVNNTNNSSTNSSKNNSKSLKLNAVIGINNNSSNTNNRIKNSLPNTIDVARVSDSIISERTRNQHSIQRRDIRDGKKRNKKQSIEQPLALLNHNQAKECKNDEVLKMIPISEPVSKNSRQINESPLLHGTKDRMQKWECNKKYNTSPVRQGPSGDGQCQGLQAERGERHQDPRTEGAGGPWDHQHETMFQGSIRFNMVYFFYFCHFVFLFIMYLVCSPNFLSM